MILDWVMKDPEFKIDYFHFVDVLPVLQTTDQVSEHIREYFLKKERELPLILKTAFKSASGGLTAGLQPGLSKKILPNWQEGLSPDMMPDPHYPY